MSKFNKSPKFDHQNEILCPACGESDMHHDETTVYDRKPSEDGPTAEIKIVGRNVEFDMPAASNNPSGRRDAVGIKFWCEHCDVISELTISQHKGKTYVEWRDTGERRKDDTDNAEDDFED